MQLSEKNTDGKTSERLLAEKEQEIKRLQEELKEARKQFARDIEKQISEINSTTLFSIESPAPQLRISLTGKILWQNPATYALETFDYHKKHFVAADFWKHIASNFPDENSWVIDVKSHTRYFSLYCRRFAKENYINIYGTDITEKIFAEEQIQVSEKRYRDLFNYAQALICTHDVAGNLITVNPAICHLLGYSENEFTGRHLTYFMPEKSRMLFHTDYLETIKARGSSEGIFTVLTKAGKKKYLLYKNYLVKEHGTEPYIIGSSQDITERKNIEDDLIRSEEKYRILIENMNLGLIELDKQGKFVFANKIFCNMCGYELEEIFGKSPGEILFDEINAAVFNNKIEDRQKGITSAYELAARNKTGEPKWWFFSGTPLYDRYNNLLGSVAVVLDITSQKLVQQQLQEAKKIADQSVKAKDDFLANMSHEIRTPMNAITGMIKQLQKTNLSQQQQLYAGAINNASSSLLVIINDILDFSKIAAGKLTIERISFRMEDVINRAVEMVADRANEKGLAIYSFIDSDIYDSMQGDPYRVKQVLVNLLSNAVKFTEKGSVTISCTAYPQEEDAQIVHIAVTDTGIGMTEEFLLNLFSMFTQEDETIARRFGGTGLGMSIIKQLVELMHGTVEVQSRKSGGTKVTVTLPFKRGKAIVTESNESLATRTGILKGKKILLVEDNELNRLLALSVLQNYSATVDQAENGLYAIKMLKESTYDIVLMDMRMPVMDGIEATMIIRKEISAFVPVIALTANAVRRDKEKCLQAGMNDFLSKPFEEKELIETILKWIGNKIGGVSKKAGDYKYFNTSKLKELGRGNAVFEQKMLNAFIREATKAIDELKASIITNDTKKIAAVAHRIKSQVDSMGVKHISKEVLAIDSSKGLLKDKLMLNNYVAKIIDTLTKVIEEIRMHDLV